MIDDRRMSVSCESLLGREEMDGWFVLSVDWDFWPAQEENRSVSNYLLSDE